MSCHGNSEGMLWIWELFWSCYLVEKDRSHDSTYFFTIIDSKWSHGHILIHLAYIAWGWGCNRHEEYIKWSFDRSQRNICQCLVCLFYWRLCCFPSEHTGGLFSTLDSCLCWSKCWPLVWAQTSLSLKPFPTLSPTVHYCSPLNTYSPIILSVALTLGFYDILSPITNWLPRYIVVYPNLV